MKLLTKELEEIFENYPIGSQDGLGGDAKVIAKFFNPLGRATWFITEAEKSENGDYTMFGYCNLGDDEMAEMGYVSLSELQNIQLPMGLTIERDLYFPKDCNLKESIESAGMIVPAFMLKDDKEEEDEEAL